MVGGAYTPKNLACLKPLRRNVLIATQGGAKAEIDLMRLLRDRLVLTGSTLRPRSADEKARLTAAVEARVWPWIEAGKIKPIVDRTFPLAEAGAAHAYVEAEATSAKWRSSPTSQPCRAPALSATLGAVCRIELARSSLEHAIAF